MDLLKDLKISLLNFSFAMIYIIHTQKIEVIKDRILRDNKNFFEHEEEENYYKPVSVNNFWSHNYTEYESSGDRNKTVSVEKYLNKIRPYLKDINNLKKLVTRKFQLPIVISLFPS